MISDGHLAGFALISLALIVIPYLGAAAIGHRHSLSAALGAARQQKNVGTIVRDGIVGGVSNPKVIVFFVAVLPQFVDRRAGHVAVQLLLGAVWSAIALACDSSWALAAGSARAWLARSPRRLAAVGGAGGLAMIGIGVGLALTGRKD